MNQETQFQSYKVGSSPSFSYDYNSQNVQTSFPSSSQQNRCCVIRCTPNLFQKISNSQPITNEMSFFSEFEKKISSQFDKSIKKHHKRIKKKLKEVNKRVLENQKSILKLQEIIERSFDEVLEEEIKQSEEFNKRKITWRRCN